MYGEALLAANPIQLSCGGASELTAVYAMNLEPKRTERAFEMPPFALSAFYPRHRDESSTRP